MTRSRMIWPGGLLALGLAVGCRHTQSQQQPDNCPTCTAAAATPTAAPQLALVPTNPPLVANVPPPLVPAAPAAVAMPPAVVQQRPAPVVVNQMPLTLTPAPAAPRTLPAVPAAPVAAVPPAAVAVNPEQSAPPPSPWGTPRAKAVEGPPAATPAPAAPVAPTPVVTTPSASTPVPAAPGAAAGPQYYNSPDYSILFGVLDYNARHGTWRLRYADAGEEDRYGGSVTLDGVGRQMQGYSSGQFVRVEGGLVDPESRDASPAYRVKEMRPGTPGR